jgi:hypothetical protein
VPHVIRDFLTGSVITATLAVAAVAALALALVLNILFQVFGVLVLLLLFTSLFFCAVWLIGFLVRKAREGGKE